MRAIGLLKLTGDRQASHATDCLPDLGGSSRESGQAGFQQPLAPTEQPPSLGRPWQALASPSGSLLKETSASDRLRPLNDVIREECIPKKFTGSAHRTQSSWPRCTDNLTAFSGYFFTELQRQ